MSALQSASPEPDAVSGDHEPTASAAAKKPATAAKSASAAKAAKGKARPKPNSRAKTPAAPRRKAATAWPAPKPQASRPEVADFAPVAAEPPVVAQPVADAQPVVEPPVDEPAVATPDSVDAPERVVLPEPPVAAAPTFEPVVDPPVEAEVPQPPVAPAAYEPPVAPQAPVAPAAYVPPAAYEPPVPPQPPVAPAAYVPPAAYEPPLAPRPPAAPEPPVAPAAYEPAVAPQPPAAPEPPVAPAAYEPPVAPQPPAAPEPPAAPAAYEPPVAPQPPVAPAAYEPPVAPQPPAAPAAYEPPAAPQPPAAPEPRPISTAGADIPAALGSALDLEAPLPFAPAPAAPQPPAAYEPPAAPQPPAAYEPPAAPQAPQPAAVAPPQEVDVVALDEPLHDAPQPPADDPSPAPPGFTAPHIQAAESPTLLALDPTVDETTAPTAGAAPAPEADAHIGGSAILTKLVSLVPKRSDRENFRSDRAATARIVGAIVVVLTLLVVFGGTVARALAGLPLVGSAFAQLESFALFPGAYGYAVWIAFLATVSAAGVVVAQMERSAERLDRRQDPVARLNIALAGMVTLAITGALLTFLSSNGWAAAAAATSFFLAACLAVPALRLPGARAMQYQPERAWVLLLVVSLISFVICPSLPFIATTVLAGIQVRRRWDAISRGDDLHQDGPVDATNRLSAILLTVFVTLASAIGMQSMTLSPDQLRALGSGAPQTGINGAEVGPTIKPPTP